MPAAQTWSMHEFAIYAIRLLSAVFFLGLLGSAVVAVISFVEDFGELFSSDENVEPPHAPRM
jgi:hypothetical protein